MSKRRTLFISFILMSVALFAQTHIQYYPTNDLLVLNPERGFYRMYDIQSEGRAFTESQIKSMRQSDQQSILMRLYYLKSFKNSDLSTKELTLITNDLKACRAGGMKMIMRLAYAGNIGETDAPLNIVLRHLDQLQPIFEEYNDVIMVLQAGFIGAWGEWHSSTNGLTSVQNMRTILEKELAVLPKNRMVEVRTPAFKQNIFNRTTPIDSSEAFDESDYSRTGHHNDCFLADATDMGTYTITDTSFQKNYLNQDCLYVPIGGETCQVNPPFSDCSNALIEMKRMRWSYIHQDWHPDVVKGWETQGCLDSIKKYIGYRIELQEGNFTTDIAPGKSMTFDLKLMNKGFAPMFNPRNVNVMLINEADPNAKPYYVSLPVDPRFWQPEKPVDLKFEIGVPAGIVQGNYKMYLDLSDPSPNLKNNPEFSVRLANDNVWQSSTGYNSLNVTLNVSENNGGTVYNDSLHFAEYDPSTDVSIENPVPSDYSIKILNYPNPFNPVTKIRYYIADTGKTTLKVFNSLGQQVSLLIDGVVNAGWHEILFNGEKLPSGIYYCVITANGKTETNKMVLLK